MAVNGPVMMEYVRAALLPFLLNNQQREALGYPQWTTSGGVHFQCIAPSQPRAVPDALNVHAPEFVPGAAVRRCARCNSLFAVERDAGCVHHSGRVVGRTYSCCGTFVGTPGCRQSRHVWTGAKLGWNGPFHDYASSVTLRGGVYAIDTEMVYTETGLELARVALTDVDGQLVFDSLVRPSAPVVDYNTEHSGITPDELNAATKTLPEVRGELFNIVGGDTILVGHALDNDLRALKMVHDMVIDTCALFPHSKGLPWRQSLRVLCLRYLRVRIQDKGVGHSPAEDARAAMDLVLWRMNCQVT